MAKTGAKSSSQPPSHNIVPELLHVLVSSYINKTPNQDQQQLTKVYKYCLNIITSNLSLPSGVTSEFKLSQKLQKKLVLEQRERDALKFVELCRNMKTQGIIKNTVALLQFFMVLSNERSSGEVRDSFLLDSSIDLPAALIPSSFNTSTASQTSTNKTRYRSSTPHITASRSASSGIGSWNISEDPSSVHMSHSTTITMSEPTLLRDHTPLLPRPPSSRPFDPTETELSEDALIRDLLYVFQGIDGKYLTMKSEGFRLAKELIIHPSYIEHCHKLSELGWLYRKVNNYIDNRKQDTSLGLVVQSFLSALSLELTEYYRLVAVLEGQVTCSHVTSKDSLTLRRLVVWTREPLEKLKTLAILVDGCKNVRGGALVSTLYSYAQHGDPQVKELVKHILNQVYRPINTLLNAWVFEGQLQDNYNEFFISADLKATEERLWHGKYALRGTMLPKFISEELAKKILTVGKSINFLRQRCHNHTELFSFEERNWFEKDKCTFDSMTGDPLSTVINLTYKRTSSYLLDVLHTHYHLRDHLHAFRKYLLLGQGDFIKHLMDTIERELAKPATSCYVHNLTAILESAIRATNAQYDEQDVLSRLDVQMLDASPGDTGWDVFSLLYRVDGPISTVFTPDTMLRYLQVFNFLWRAKRIEFILSGMWRNQMTNQRQLRNIPGKFFQPCTILQN